MLWRCLGFYLVRAQLIFGASGTLGFLHPFLALARQALLITSFILFSVLRVPCAICTGTHFSLWRFKRMPRVYCTGNHLPSCARCACPVCIALAHILILALQARASVRLHTRRVESSISAFVLCAFSALGTSALSFLCAFSALGKALSASLRVQRSGPGPFFSAPSALWARPFLLCAFSAFLICACCACLVRIALALWVSLGDPLQGTRRPGFLRGARCQK